MSFDPVHKIITAFVTGEISQEKADQLLERTKEVNDGSLHVFFSDQRPQYREAILKSFGQWVQPKRKGTRGRFPKPRLEPPEDLLYAQVVKHRRKGRVVKITEKVVFGTQEALQAYLERSPVSRRINTALPVGRQVLWSVRITRCGITIGASPARHWASPRMTTGWSGKCTCLLPTTTSACRTAGCARRYSHRFLPRAVALPRSGGR